MAQHAQLRLDIGLTIYFCDPHSPWQRGTNENTNGLLRQYFPKGHRPQQTRPRSRRCSPQQPPRKTLNWRTPAEALNDLLHSCNQPTALRYGLSSNVTI